MEINKDKVINNLVNEVAMKTRDVNYMKVIIEQLEEKLDESMKEIESLKNDNVEEE